MNRRLTAIGSPVLAATLVAAIGGSLLITTDAWMTGIRSPAGGILRPEDRNSAANGVTQIAPALQPVTYRKPSIMSRYISRSSDDAEEKASGKITLSSADLELVDDTTNQIVGLRFQNIAIPRGSTIVRAMIQFRVDEDSSEDVSLRLHGELVADAKTFSSTRHDISSRPPTQSSVAWSPGAWKKGAEGRGQASPDLTPIIQEIVNQQAWVSGNALSIIISGSGRRVAESFDGSWAPVLHVAYQGNVVAPVRANTFACLDAADNLVVVKDTNRTERYEARAQESRIYDARNASFLISETSHGIIVMDGNDSQEGMCWAGGYVWGNKPGSASWDDWKHDPVVRNSAVINLNAASATVTGMHFVNVHDGPRITDAPDWTVQHVWGESVRDDCIENDHLHSGTVFDSLFDGCYTGISTRPPRGRSADGRGKVITLDRVLVRMRAFPYPYEYQSKPGIITKDGEPWDGTGVPYGHGSLFKYDQNNLEQNVHFIIKNCVFFFPYEHVSNDKLSLPPSDLIDELSNVTIVWLGANEFPGELPLRKFPNGIRILTGRTGWEFWREKVFDWHRRHPDVDPTRKPVRRGTARS